MGWGYAGPAIADSRVFVMDYQPTDEYRAAGPSGKDHVEGVERVLCLSAETGHLILAQLSPEGYRKISRAHILEPTSDAFGRPVVWSQPAFALRSALARNDKDLVRVDLSAP